MPHFNKVHLGVGSLRAQGETRQYGALLMVTGLCAVIQPLGSLVTAIGTDGMESTFLNPNEPPLWQFIGGICLLAVGVVSFFTGFAECVQDAGSTNITTYAILLTQTAYIPYIAGMAGIGKVATQPAPQFWTPLDDTGVEARAEMSGIDVQFIGAMGILGLASYGFSFVGSIAFMQFSLHTFHAATPEDRNASYFAGRLSFYSLVLCVAGISQLMLGSYLLTNFDLAGGKLVGGFVSVSVYTVLYPPLSMAVGAIQTINGLWGFARSLDVAHTGPDDALYACSMAFQWLAMIIVQFIVQIGYLPGGRNAPQAPSLAAMSLGLSLMPAYLDYKWRNTLSDIPIDYYGYIEETDDLE